MQWDKCKWQLQSFLQGKRGVNSNNNNEEMVKVKMKG
jgi:hypothetical protein